MTDKIIKGSGGGPPPSPPQPSRAPDTLNSRQFATIQDLLSEGEIEGFATPSKAGLTKGSTAYNNAALKDIFLNDTPILNANASNTSPGTADFNFQNVGFTPRFGTSNQGHIPGIESSQSTTSVGVTVTNSTPVTRQITNTNVDAAKVTITFPQLQKATDEGDLLGSTVDLKIQIQYNGGGFNDVLSDTITGRTADAYQKEYRVNLTGAFPVDVRVVRVTADSTSSNLVDSFSWTSLGEIVDDKQTYPNSAYTNLRIDSEQFSSIPRRAFRIRGVKVRIPGAGASNSGTPTVDLQTGRIIYPSGYIFNGTMGAAVWCSCPAMILLDLLTTERYGFGTHITDANLDLFSFVAASRYANELVDDGFGGQEARFSCNVNLQGSMEAYQLINELAGVMRCFPIWSEGSVTITQDRPTDPSYLFSLANVGEGGFSYSGSSLKQRHSVISVSYFNMDSREIDYEVVEDTAAQAKLGIVKKDVKAFACTSRGQAQRLGKAILFSEQNESEVISFTTSIDAGAIVRPGSVISVNDPVRGGERRSGRINAATTTQITVDNTQDLNNFSGSNRKCSVILPDGSVETKNVIGVVNNVITLDSALSATPNVNSIWLLQSSTLEPQTFRVISVEEQDGINYAITALTYIDGKYANIESGISLPSRSISLLNEPKDPPGNLQASERVVVINALAVTKIILSWVSVTGVSQYLVQYRFNNTNWVSEIVFRPDFELLNTEAGAYEFKVFSFNAALTLSPTSSDLTFNAVGKTAPPGDVENLSMEPITNKLVRLRWTKAVDPDVLHGGRVYVRHSNLTDGSGTFQNSVDLVTALAGNTTDVVVPSLEGEYILKFQDDQGNFSVGEASIIQDLPDLIDTQVILQDREDLDNPPFNGTKLNTTFSSSTSALQLTDPSVVLTGLFTDNGTVITIFNVQSQNLTVGETVSIRFTAGLGKNGQYTVLSTPSPTSFTVASKTNIGSSGTVSIDRGLIGEYEFKDILDLGAVFSLDLKRVIRSVGFVIGQDIETLIPGAPGILWDQYALNGNFDGQAADEANCQVLVATSQAGSGNFGDFNNFANGTFKGRRFKFKLVLETTDTAQNMNVQQAGYTAEFQSRTERNYQTGGTISTAPQSSGTSAKTVTFGKPFFTGTTTLGGSTTAFLPSVGITIQDAEGGDFFKVTNVSGTGFTVTIKNKDTSGNETFVNRTFTFQAVGYGKGV
jgi:predicted phage tail protein